MASSDSSTTVGLQSQLGCPFFDFAPPYAFDFDQKKLHKTLHKLFLTITWQNNFFLPWIGWSSAFNFRNMFWKTYNWNCFRFWWKTYRKRCKSNYVISSVKRLCSTALFGWSGALNYYLEKRTWWWKYRFWFCSAFAYFGDLKAIYFFVVSLL